MTKTLEQTAEENERRIVRFTNIDKESFTHSFRGISITVKVGESYVCRFPEGDHLAKHLARKILARAKKEKGEGKDPRGGILYTDAEVEGLKDKIVKDLGTETLKTTPIEDKRKQDIETLTEKYDKKPQPEEITKSQVIKDLKTRGVEPDIKKSKEELLKQLMELESKP